MAAEVENTRWPPITWALADPNERQVLMAVLDQGSELPGGRSIDGVGAGIAQRRLALTAAIWHNRATGQPVTRSPIAYDH